VEPQEDHVFCPAPIFLPKFNSRYRCSCYINVIRVYPKERSRLNTLQIFIKNNVRQTLLVVESHGNLIGEIFFFFLSFRRVVNVIYSFLGNSPASEI